MSRCYCASGCVLCDGAGTSVPGSSHWVFDQWVWHGFTGLFRPQHNTWSYAHYYRMHKAMVSWHLSRRIPKQKCIFYMLHTVCILQIANTGESLTSLGVGALVSPLVATQFAQLPHWSFHYLTSLGIAIINVVFLTSVFKLMTQDGERTNITSLYNLPDSLIHSHTHQKWAGSCGNQHISSTHYAPNFWKQVGAPSCIFRLGVCGY